MQDFLEDVVVSGIRGIENLRVSFNYPVVVLAGPNGCGKTTILNAAACAYKVPGAKVREFVPSTKFPNFQPKDRSAECMDHQDEIIIDYSYIHAGQRTRMRWKKSKSWGRSFFGEKGADQPERQVYERQLSEFSHPSGVRSLLMLQQKEFEIKEVDASLITLAQRILRNNYVKLYEIIEGEKNLLFAKCTLQGGEEQGREYSEFHMSSGERAILRLSKELSTLKNALVLIDELETGLHPFIQEQLMLELQRLALRNNLQVIVTSHSPMVLETVPPDARVFMERIGERVEIKPPYRDLIQHSLYGLSHSKLSILCEDDVAEGVLLGIFDHLNLKLQLRHQDVAISRDSGKDEFKNHYQTLKMMGRLRDFIFVLDGDATEVCESLKNQPIPVSCYQLPGERPEDWLLGCLRENESYYSERLGFPENLKDSIDRICATYEGSTSKPAEIAKLKYYAVSQEFNKVPKELARSIGKMEAERQRGDLMPLISHLEDAVHSWRERIGEG